MVVRGTHLGSFFRTDSDSAEQALCSGERVREEEQEAAAAPAAEHGRARRGAGAAADSLREGERVPPPPRGCCSPKPFRLVSSVKT